MEDKSKYTGRKIAIFTDAHSLLEPTVAVLEDARSRGITEIYSLGDNIGFGPNPGEVMDVMDAYGVVSIAGNAEEYSILGLKPFSSYMNGERIAEQVWLESKLTNENIDQLKLYKRSIDLALGGKKIALCHFAKSRLHGTRLRQSCGTDPHRCRRSADGVPALRKKLSEAL